MDHSLDLTAEKLQSLQEGDETLSAARRAAKGEMNSAGKGFFLREGLLYRRWEPPGQEEGVGVVEQLVLPEQCRRTVLRLAHEIPLSGHMGKRKTAQRILQRFYWPSLYRDVAEFIKSCTECQKVSPRRVKPAPLIPLPIIEEPFSRIALDVVGPLPRSRSGNRFILVMCDYATRYPEAVPLRSVDAEHVAEELVKLFTRVGVPAEILTDQGSNFMSQLLREVYRLLHVEPIRTSPYHPQTDGLVERFNQTLKAMLKKAASEDGKDWDRLIPYLLFAYREVPQSSTGFSPFELLYGRQVRGPLDILRETWEAKARNTESVISYVLAMREKLSKMRDLVQQNLKQSQAEQKVWYDRNARSRVFEPGTEVLVLLPTSASKLLARWQGPYKIVRKVGQVNYEVDMDDKRKRKRVLHINLLRKWHAPNRTFVALEDDRTDWDEVPPAYTNGAEGQKLNISDRLTQKQREELNDLLERFPEVLCNEPGKTNLIEHHIETGSASPLRQPPYRLPYAQRGAVLEELREMETRGLIEPSTSEWSAPIVAVEKKDGTLRLCVDYRRLNNVTRTDAYPMPRIDELLDRIGQAKYITTMDLTRGYWQVPMAEQSQPKTAFTTPRGLYQFTVMPFGLCGAPATFQRLMDQLLHGLEGYAAAYLDDIVVFSESWEEHRGHLLGVLEQLRKAGLTLKPHKCQFAMTECVYLGHVVGNGIVRPEMTKVEAVEQFPTPSTKKEVRQFLGLAGYYRRFIPEFASIAAPITDLTRKEKPVRVKWSEECEAAFKKLKEMLVSNHVLRSPNMSLPFVLETDASDRGVGAVLTQVDEAGEEHPVAFFSQKLLPREEKYATVEKECLAIRLGIEAFRVYLLGRPFTVRTDQRALEWLDKMRDTNSRLTRWSLALQPYQFRVCYRPGSSNSHADALSRCIRDRAPN